MALLCTPKIIIADEPTTSLDVLAQRQIISCLKTWQKTNKSSIIFITHDLQLASSLCDRIIVMYKGEKIEELTKKEVIEKKFVHPYSKILFSISLNNNDIKILSQHLNRAENKLNENLCCFLEECPIKSKSCMISKPQDVFINKNHIIKCFLGGDNK